VVEGDALSLTDWDRKDEVWHEKRVTVADAERSWEWLPSDAAVASVRKHGEQRSFLFSGSGGDVRYEELWVAISRERIARLP
jgi:hypothetical protein